MNYSDFNKIIYLEEFTAYNLSIHVESELSFIKISDKNEIYYIDANKIDTSIAEQFLYSYDILLVTRSHRRINIRTDKVINNVVIKKNNALNKLYHLYILGKYFCDNPNMFTIAREKGDTGNTVNAVKVAYTNEAFNQSLKFTQANLFEKIVDVNIVSDITCKGNTIRFINKSLYGAKKNYVMELSNNKNSELYISLPPNNKHNFHGIIGYKTKGSIKCEIDLNNKKYKLNGLADDRLDNIITLSSVIKKGCYGKIGLHLDNISDDTNYNPSVNIQKFICYELHDNINMKFRMANSNTHFDIMVVIAFLGRSLVLEKVLDTINSTFYKNKLNGLNIGIVLAGSTETDHKFIKKMEKKYDNIYHILVPNNPIGLKWQLAVSYARLFNCDSIMILGSDDVFCKNYIPTLYSYIKDGYDFIGKREWYILNIKNDNTINLFKAEYGDDMEMSLGAGRIYSRKFLDNCDWYIFDFLRNKGLDEYGHYQLTNANNKVVNINNRDNVHILSLKGEWDQMNSFDKLFALAKTSKKISMEKFADMYIEDGQRWLKKNFGTSFIELNDYMETKNNKDITDAPDTSDTSFTSLLSKLKDNKI